MMLVGCMFMVAATTMMMIFSQLFQVELCLFSLYFRSISLLCCTLHLFSTTLRLLSRLVLCGKIAKMVKKMPAPVTVRPASWQLQCYFCCCWLADWLVGLIGQLMFRLIQLGERRPTRVYVRSTYVRTLDKKTWRFCRILSSLYCMLLLLLRE